jgi:hypothetical protein
MRVTNRLRAAEDRHEHGQTGDGEQQVGQAQHQVDEPGQDPVDPAPREAGDEPDDDAEERGDQGRRAGHDQRRPGAVGPAGEQVATEPGFDAEPVLGRGPDRREAVVVDEFEVRDPGVLTLDRGERRGEDRDQDEHPGDGRADHGDAVPAQPAQGDARGRPAGSGGTDGGLLLEAHHRLLVLRVAPQPRLRTQQQRLHPGTSSSARLRTARPTPATGSAERSTYRRLTNEITMFVPAGYPVRTALLLAGYPQVRLPRSALVSGDP